MLTREVARQDDGFWSRWFSPSGRSSRGKYLLTLVGLLAAMFVFSFAALLVLDETAYDSVTTLAGLGMSPLWIIAHIRRLHDLGRSGWFVLLFLIPVVNFIFWLWLLLAPGKDFTDA